MSTPLLNRQARQALLKHCRTESELEQLILDHFQKERHLLPRGVDRLSTENRLIEVVGARAILRALEGPRYYVAWLLQGAGVLGLVVGVGIAAKQLRSGPIETEKTVSTPAPAMAPPVTSKGQPAPETGTGMLPPAVVPGSSHLASTPKTGGRAARSQCPAGGVMLERTSGTANFQTVRLPAQNGYARAGKLRLLESEGATPGQLLTTATIVEAEGSRMEVHPESAVSALKVCAVLLGEVLHAGKELGKLLEDNRINLGSGDGVKVGALYEVLGDAVMDAESTGRSLGRKKIGTVRVTAVDSLYSEVKRVDGDVAKGSFVRAKRGEGERP